MIKRLAPALKKKAGKSSRKPRVTASKTRTPAVRASSNRAHREKELTLAAEEVFLIYDARENAKT